VSTACWSVVVHSNAKEAPSSGGTEPRTVRTVCDASSIVSERIPTGCESRKVTLQVG
jgi:hypothetical protein